VKRECLAALDNCRIEVEAGRLTGLALQGFCPSAERSTYWLAAVGTVPLFILELLGFKGGPPPAADKTALH
jgi:hypothetical protein